jgi:hypothetical protein
MTDPKHSQRPRTLGEHLLDGLRRNQFRRKSTILLLAACIPVLLLGTQLSNFRDDPTRFAIVLSLMFLFFFAVMVRALLDVNDAVRGYFRERDEPFRQTLGEDRFVSELRARLQHGDDAGSDR